MSGVSQRDRDAIRDERKHALGFFNGELEAVAGVKREVDAPTVKRGCFQIRDAPTVQHDRVVFHRSDELERIAVSNRLWRHAKKRTRGGARFLGSSTDQWAVGQPAARGLTQEPLDALRVGQLAGRVPEVELPEVAVQVLAAHVMVGAVH